MTVLSRRALGRATLARQGLLERQAWPVTEAVERVGGLQAQEPRPPHLGLWSRLADFDPGTLRAAVAEKAVVRATLMRGTLHLMSAADYLAVRSALQPALVAGLKVVGDRAAGLEPAEVLPVADRLLADGPQTFAALRDGLAEAFPDVDHRVAGYLVRLQLPLVMVPTDDAWGFSRDPAFARADRYLDEPVAADPSPAHLLRRYLGAFGPASATDAQRWTGLGGLKAAFEPLRDELVVFRDERGRELFDLPDAPRPGEDVAAPPRLLPAFDSLVLAHDDRTRVLADAHKGAVVTRNLRINPTFLLDGEVAGTWALARKGRYVTVTLTPFGRLPAAARRALLAEAEALAAIAEPDAGSWAAAVAR